MRRISAIATTALVALLVWGLMRTFAGAVQAPSETVLVYHSHIPLGAENLAVDGWNVPLTVLALASNPQFEGWRRQTVNTRFALLDAGGAPVRYFPETVDFRVTVSTRLKLDNDPPLFPLHTNLSPDAYPLNLHFQLKIFHGLRQSVLAPQTVELIGVPADIPYPDRIYHLSFALPHVPTTDRIVLEVLSPEGERICKFHLDLD